MRNWVDKHFVATSFLIALTVEVIVFSVISTFFPQTSAAANSVRTTTPTASCVNVDSNDWYVVRECKVPLKDGRTVTCVNIVKGTPCDWDHATTRKVK